MDTAERLTIDEEDTATQQFIAVAPRLGLAVREAYACTFFPEAADPRADVTGRGAGPIVLCGATGDPATPLEGTRRMADTLEDGRLIVIEADQHICYGVDDCADALIEEYLVNLAVPPERDGVLRNLDRLTSPIWAAKPPESGPRAARIADWIAGRPERMGRSLAGVIPLDRIGGAPITWGVCEVPGWGVMLPADRVLTEMRSLGITATELGAPGFLPRDPDELRAVLDRNGMSLIGGFVPVGAPRP